jgi:hypothetical protein
LNSAAECAGSRFQVVTEVGVSVDVLMGVLLCLAWMLAEYIRCNKYLT